MEFCASNGRLQPGFRFHPTNQELVMYYLKRKVLGKCLIPEIVTEVDVYQYHPMDLRNLACLKKDLNWYFFCHRGNKYLCGKRKNRATDSGFWKATGNDRVVTYDDRTVGMIKTLVFHEGKPPKGTRTDWVMHEYRLEDQQLADKGVSQDSYVLCKIFKKSGWGPKNSEQYGAPFVEEEWNDDDDNDDVINPPPFPVNEYAPSSLGQFYPGTVSVSTMDQVPSPIPNAAANTPSFSEGVIPGYDYVVDHVFSPVSNDNDHSTVPMPNAVGIASTSTCPFANYNDHPTVEAYTPMPNAVDIASTPTVEASTLMPHAVGKASTSTGLLAEEDDDSISRMMDRILVEESRGIFEGLPDLDCNAAWAVESSSSSIWGGIDKSGMFLDDLDLPL
uniref:NAC domain containing transcription factor NAC9 n=1 Tax=Fagopyrum tataricum TaxID=62330 RepID=A0A385A3S8_FAGTA|nr:NAC domain containing transcription factor NAC9 [Fagopyrum tataricum]